MTEPDRRSLADGRALLYFDDAGHTPGARPDDARTLPDRPGAGHMRFDALRGEWIAYAAHRQTRTHLPNAAECPLCPTTPGRESEVPAADYDVAVFENRFPSFGPAQHEQDLDGHLGATAPAHGRCEVVVFGPEHDRSLAEMPLARLDTLVGAWAHRTAELSALPGIRQVFPFENRGAEIGVTLHHPHGQIYAYPVVPPVMERMLDQAIAHRVRTGDNLFADLLAEARGSERELIAGAHWTAFVPAAARMPIEIHVVPHAERGNLAELTAEERSELAEILLRTLRAVDALYETPTPYIAAWYQAPIGHPAAGEFRLHLEITSPRRAADKLKFLAGSEAAMGAFIGDVLPEVQAEALRDALGRIEPVVREVSA